MSTFSKKFPGKWTGNGARLIISAVTYIIFLFLDFLDKILCVVYRFLDEFIEGNGSSCYCEKVEEVETRAWKSEEGEVSETLYGRGRTNFFREMGFLTSGRKWDENKKNCGGFGSAVNRWSDCGCASCISWQHKGDHKKLHVIVAEPSEANIQDCDRKPTENVIFLHGFLSSSSFWTEIVFPNLSESVKKKHRLFAVDLLGFGRSPKPRDCFYTLKDHLEMIEKSVICPFQLNSFHLVAHSMGCIIALALAAKYPKSVKSITLVAPPYFPASKDTTSARVMVLGKVAERKLWPPLSFGSAVMSWYEHLGRCVCFLICRNHRIWEWILKLLIRKRELHFLIVDLTRHTHHSAWHTMHNVICGSAKSMGDYLKAVNENGMKLKVIQGDRDQVVPLECSNNIKIKVPDAEVKIILNADHTTVILGRGKYFTRDLEDQWDSFT